MLSKVICIIVLFLTLTLTVPAFGRSISVGGGITNPHSEDDGDSCLNEGWFGSVSYDEDIFSTRRELLTFKLGGTLYHLEYSESDRENVNSKRTNTHRRTDNIATVDGKVQFSLWKFRPFIKGSIGTDLYLSKDLYYAIIPGINIALTESFSVELYKTELSNNDTFHRITGISIRYEF